MARPGAGPARVAVWLFVAAMMFLAGRATAGPQDLTVRRVPADAGTAGLADPVALVGVAGAVFVGRVVAKVGQRDGPVPQTRFRVRVLQSITGELAGDVVVSQRGGYRRHANELVLTDGDSLLEPGRDYLIATDAPAGSGPPHVIPVYGDRPVGDGHDREQLIDRFRAAAAARVGSPGGGRARFL
jgi:hypothetical protein